MIKQDRLKDQVKNKDQVGLKVAINILNKWGCSEHEKMSLLGVSRSTLHKYQQNPFSARVSPDLLERVSYLLNIHSSLRILFENNENVYGFVRMPNTNYYFNGASPMDIMSKGTVGNLYEVHNQINTLRGGQW